MPDNISKHTLGLTQLQSGQGIPNHNADKGSLYIDVLTTDYYKNTNGLNTWILLSSGAASGDYLPLSGGTVTGGTVFTSGVTANTISNVNYIDFNLTATTTHQEGRIHWNDSIKTLEVDTENAGVQLKVGHELVVRVNNQTGSAIPKGRAVYINGEQGQRPTITLASFTADSTSAAVVGLTMTEINDSSNGYVIVNGLLEGSASYPLDTSSYTAGTPLYLYTGGTLTSTKPQAPDHDVRIGKVVVSNSTTGSIYVSIQNGYELDELHDVRIISKTTGDLITLSAYNGNDVWVNSKTLNGSYTITGNTNIGLGLTASTISATTISANTITSKIYENIGGLRAVPLATSNAAVTANSYDYYMNVRIPHSITASTVLCMYSTLGSDSTRVAIYRGRDTTATLVGQGFKAGATLTTISEYTLTATTGQTLSFSGGEWIVIAVAVGGTTTVNRSATTYSSTDLSWFNTTDSAAGGFPTNPRAKGGTLTSFPCFEIF